MSPRIVGLRDSLLTECVSHGEMECISIDATMRCCMPILGQSRLKATAEERAQAAFAEEESYRRDACVHLHSHSKFVLCLKFGRVDTYIYIYIRCATKVITVRGRTNAVLLMKASAGEDADTVCFVLSQALTAAALAQIQFVTVDNPSRRYLNSLKSICPGLQGMALDTVHLAMTCEYATARRRSPATKALRRLLSKFAAVDKERNPVSFGAMFDGNNARPATAEENRYRGYIEDLTMRDEEARRIIDSLDYDKPWYLRIEWIRALAALANVYRQDMQRMCPGPNRRIGQLLLSAAAPERCEWYFNNIRVRHNMHVGKLTLFPVGTTSNESLHFEVNRWFKETQKLHKATLELKLDILSLGKLLSHNRALYHAGMRQMSHGEVLARSTRQVLWSEQEWKAWCDELDNAGKVKRKADLPVQEARRWQKARVQDAALKKPASALSQTGQKHRTPHSLERKDQFLRGGKKNKFS